MVTLKERGIPQGDRYAAIVASPLARFQEICCVNPMRGWAAVRRQARVKIHIRKFIFENKFKLKLFMRK
jgi:hypothetical protein